MTLVQKEYQIHLHNYIIVAPKSEMSEGILVRPA